MNKVSYNFPPSRIEKEYDSMNIILVQEIKY